MRNKIFGGIGVVWGGLIVANGLLSGRAAGSAAYETGQTTGLIIGAIMLLAGLYYIFKRPNEPK